VSVQFNSERHDTTNDTTRSALGAVVKPSVTRGLTMLVCGDKPSPAKVKKARELGVEIVSEEQFRALLLRQRQSPEPPQ
jgi:NAD-dependent DNA ligase